MQTWTVSRFMDSMISVSFMLLSESQARMVFQQEIAIFGHLGYSVHNMGNTATVIDPRNMECVGTLQLRQDK